ncbi:unnamed protein product, partial [Gongylonema pulchrum]|uniref:ShKT domain-containing protein n=1 Tax=Gongylonema pulchrum TaxID=637853 RepID=A0A183DLU6_9BILA
MCSANFLRNVQIVIAEPKVCVDDSMQCAAEKDKCLTHINMMAQKCPVSCGFCSTSSERNDSHPIIPSIVITNGQCIDTVNNCEQFKQQCNQVEHISRLASQCAKTCHFCKTIQNGFNTITYYIPI